MADREQKAHLIDRFFRSIVNGGNAESLRQILSENVRWHVPQSVMPKFRGPHVGIAAAIDLVGGAGGSLFVQGTAQFTLTDVLIDGDKAAVQCRNKARMTAGPEYDNAYAFFLRFEGGKIAEVWEHADMGYIFGLLAVDPTWVRERDWLPEGL